ncbi:MAG TPA: hypothetical protein VHE61_10330 [Opitutaceae bacterium]|nr:hypothetical protein [Opitutaceae bacterium]
MFKRLISSIAARIALARTPKAAETFAIGGAAIPTPGGWNVVNQRGNRIVFQSEDQRQQATLSVSYFGNPPSFDDFKALSTRRLQAEKKAAPDAFLEPDPPVPFEKDGRFGLLYTGGQKSSGRVFSCSFGFEKDELVTVYVEGIGIDPKVHLASFETFVAAVRSTGRSSP